MKDIELVISEGIKNGRWIDISYENSNNEIYSYNRKRSSTSKNR